MRMGVGETDFGSIVWHIMFRINRGNKWWATRKKEESRSNVGRELKLSNVDWRVLGLIHG
jgi:hypothetical protein